MKCVECGAEIPENSKFCLECGKQVERVEQQPSNGILVEDRMAVNKDSQVSIEESSSPKKEPSKYKKRKQRNNAITALIAFIVIFIGFISCMHGEEAQDVNNRTGLHKRIHEEARVAVDNKDWNGALEKLLRIESEYKCSQCDALREYARAMRLLNNDNATDADIIKAYNHLNKINLDDLSHENDFYTYFRDIKQAKQDIAERYNSAKARQDVRDAEEKQQEKDKAAQKAAERDSHIYIGDPESKIRSVFGTPDQVNRTVVGGHEEKQYVYDRGSKLICIYTENGIVTGFQD